MSISQLLTTNTSVDFSVCRLPLISLIDTMFRHCLDLHGCLDTLTLFLLPVPAEASPCLVSLGCTLEFVRLSLASLSLDNLSHFPVCFSSERTQQWEQRGALTMILLSALSFLPRERVCKCWSRASDHTSCLSLIAFVEGSWDRAKGKIDNERREFLLSSNTPWSIPKIAPTFTSPTYLGESISHQVGQRVYVRVADSSWEMTSRLNERLKLNFRCVRSIQSSRTQSWLADETLSWEFISEYLLISLESTRVSLKTSSSGEITSKVAGVAIEHFSFRGRGAE